MRERPNNNAPAWLAGIALMIGLSLAVMAPLPAQAAPDTDLDGVADASDHCPYTPKGARVDASGCSSNSDRDGDRIADESDDCPTSPRGAQVDAHGCAVDDDRDGVANGPDVCPRSAPGLKVDARGCAPGQVAGVSSSVKATPVVAAASAPVVASTAGSTGVLLSVDFQPLSTAVDAAGQSRLKTALPKLRQALANNSSQVLEIRGYADAVSDGARAQVLASARASKLREMLEAKGFDRSRLRNASQWPGPASARRVELVLAPK